MRLVLSFFYERAASKLEWKGETAEKLKEILDYMHTRRLWHSIFLYVIYPIRERSYICINVYPSSSRCSHSLFLSPYHIFALPSRRFLFYVRYTSLSWYVPLCSHTFSLSSSFHFYLTLFSHIPMDLHETPFWISIYSAPSLFALRYFKYKSVTSTHTNVHTRCHLRFFILYIYMYIYISISIYTCIYAIVCLPVYTCWQKLIAPCKDKIKQINNDQN